MRDRQFLLKHFSNVIIDKMTSLILIREVDDKIVKIDEFIIIKLYFDDELNDVCKTRNKFWGPENDLESKSSGFANLALWHSGPVDERSR